MSQEAHSKDILKKNKMENNNPVTTLMEPGAKLSRFDGGDQITAIKY